MHDDFFPVTYACDLRVNWTVHLKPVKTAFAIQLHQFDISITQTLNMVVTWLSVFSFAAQVFLVIACPDYPVNVTASLKPGWRYIVQSPGFPDTYPPNTTCIWNITGPDDYRIYLILDEFQIEPSRYCDNDYLQSSSSFHNVHWISSGYCSVLSHNYIKSLSYKEKIRNSKLAYGRNRNLWLKFRTDGSSEFKGFHGEIRLAAQSDDRDCQSYLNDTSGSFASPKHPSLYPPEHLCTWHIAVPDGKKVHLKFTSFELENTTNNDGDCANDYVEIREGVWNNYGEILGRFCGEAIPQEVISPSNQMWVRFVSDSNVFTVYKGFKAEFSGSSIMTSYGATMCILNLLLTFWS